MEGAITLKLWYLQDFYLYLSQVSTKQYKVLPLTLSERRIYRIYDGKTVFITQAFVIWTFY